MYSSAAHGHHLAPAHVSVEAQYSGSKDMQGTNNTFGKTVCQRLEGGMAWTSMAPPGQRNGRPARASSYSVKQRKTANRHQL